MTTRSPHERRLLRFHPSQLRCFGEQAARNDIDWILSSLGIKRLLLLSLREALSPKQSPFGRNIALCNIVGYFAESGLKCLLKIEEIAIRFKGMFEQAKKDLAGVLAARTGLGGR